MEKAKYMPFVLTAVIIAADQLTKAVIVATIPFHHIGASFLGGFFRIVHTRNLAVAFSIGRGLPDIWRTLLFILLPILFLGALGVYYWKTDALSRFQRWMIAGVIGGGSGNLIDRIFRPEGVVDFLDVKFYGIFGMERWPTFNIADASVVVCGILLAVSFLRDEFRSEQEVSSK